MAAAYEGRVVAVVAAAALGSRVAGAIAALSAATWFDFFLTRPYLVGLLGLRGCRFEYGTLMGNLPRLDHGGGLWLRRGNRVTEYADWPDGATELRGTGGGHYYGPFLLTPLPGRPLPSEEARLVSVAPAAQAGSSLDTAGLSPRG